MGLLYHAFKVPKLLTFTFFTSIFANASYFLVRALTRLGLYKPPPPPPREQENASSRDNFNGRILIADSSSPSLVRVPVQFITRLLKDKLPIVRYRDLIQQTNRKEGSLSASEEGVTLCTVCLDLIELRSEVRLLCNCKHLFHSECLDRWIDEGRISCPLCRSMLLPPRTILKSYHRANREAILQRRNRVNREAVS